MYIMPPFVLYIFLVIILVWLIALTYFLLLPEKKNSDPVPSGQLAGWRFALVRFNPFADTGGEQSFVLSLLNPTGSGILITSLHGRGVTRLYAKEVKHGKTDTELSAEEKSALTQALSSHD